MPTKGYQLKIIRPPGCLTPAEVAKNLGVTSAAVRIWIANGKLVAARTKNGYLWIREKDLKAYMNNRFKGVVFKDQSKNVLQHA